MGAYYSGACSKFDLFIFEKPNLAVKGKQRHNRAIFWLCQSDCLCRDPSFSRLVLCFIVAQAPSRNAYRRVRNHVGPLQYLSARFCVKKSSCISYLFFWPSTNFNQGKMASSTYRTVFVDLLALWDGFEVKVRRFRARAEEEPLERSVSS